MKINRKRGRDWPIFLKKTTLISNSSLLNKLEKKHISISFLKKWAIHVFFFVYFRPFSHCNNNYKHSFNFIDINLRK